MAGTFPESWQEACLVTIQKKGGTAYQFAAISDDVGIGEPEYEGESRPNNAGGRVWKQGPWTDGEFTLKLWPLNVDTTLGQGLAQEFIGGTWDTSQPLSTDTTYPVAGVMQERDKFIVAIMWTTDTAQTSAISATSATDKVALRFYAKECRITSHKTEWSDKELTTEVTLKYPAVLKDGSALNFAWESTNATQTTTNLPALTYT